MLGIILACSAIAVVSWRSDILSIPAGFMAFLMGSIIWTLNGFNWIFLFLAFMIFGYMGTKWRYDWKIERGLEESPTGRRGIENVLGNGIAPTFFAILGNPVAFSGAIASALSDTLASEIGMLSERSRLITTFEPVRPGTNGGVSPLGMTFSLIGASSIALVSYFIFSVPPLLPFIGGFLGCQVDSVLGATLERSGYLTNSTVNLIATFSGGSIALLFTSL